MLTLCLFLVGAIAVSWSLFYMTGHLPLLSKRKQFPDWIQRFVPDIDMVDTLTIVGVVFGIAVLFKVAPDFVRIEKVEEVHLDRFEAKQWLTTKPGFSDSTLTPFYVRGFIVNDGDKIGMSYAVDFSVPRVGVRGGVLRPYSAFVTASNKSLFPQLSSLDWYHAHPMDGVNIDYDDSCPRVELPPIIPQGQIGIALGLAKQSSHPWCTDRIIKSLAKPLTIRLLKFRRGASSYEIVDSMQVMIDTIKYHDATL
ncbi:MAG: hypothetical protein IPH75_14645 [bacterium]|nr:hypothetical protein [bacterium]